MDDFNASKLSTLEPRTKIGDIADVWPEIQRALEKKISIRKIYEELKTGGLTVSYETFTRWVKKQLEQSPKSVMPEKKPPVAVAVKQKDENPLREKKGFVYGGTAEIDPKKLF